MSPPLEVALLPASAGDDELDAFFEACPTSVAQQTPGWRDVIRGIDADEPLFLGCRSGGRLVGVLPGYRFEGPLGAILTSVPQAGPLGGVAALPETDADAVYAALLGAYADLARERGCAFASAISSPFWPDAERYRRHLRPDFELVNACQVLDLDEALDDDGHFALADGHVRRHLKKAASAGLVVDEEQGEDAVREWYALHRSRHAEIGATPLPEAIFTGALRHMVPRSKARFFFVRDAATGRLVAGGFYVLHGRVMDALMPAVPKEGAKLGANYLLASHSIRWAQERGIRFYNWQASPPEGGVRRFKRQWGSRDAEYGYFTRTTGDAAPFLASTPEAIAAGYPWHYVLPFDRLTGTGDGPSTREGAWTALEASR